ncbi:hypothetical protein N665_0720s0001 [Sinapis alba]|nr:hypothetical protein N665_0720s0001 [Sinapis alba]
MMGNWGKKRDDQKGLVWKLFEDIGNVGPALGLGAGCGFGLGAGLTGGYGPGLPKLQFGVGFGLGFGVGRGVVFDHARAFNNVVEYLWWKFIDFGQSP